MIILRATFTFSLLFISWFSVLAQEFHHCGASSIFNNAATKAFLPGGKLFEQWIEKKQKEDESKTLTDDNSLYVIPVVVHVLHNGEAIGTDRNLSDQRVQSQIDILNNDFGKLSGTPGFNTHPAGADTRIRFCLASQDPNGAPTNGINRVNTNRDGFNFLTDNLVLKAFGTWNTDKYLNIWVCKILGNQYIGYAQYPYVPGFLSDSLPMTEVTDVLPDGVVVDYRVFGDVPPGQSGPFPSYNKGRTTTHEIGHYLGLIHIWGDGNSCSDPINTDFCLDTPKQGEFTSGCPTAALPSCTSGVPKMKENYMDYTNDGCMNIFTQDQKKRMRIVLRNCIRRKSLLTSPIIPCSLTADSQPEPIPLKRDIRVYFQGNDENSNVLLIESPDETSLSEIALFDYNGRLIYSKSLQEEIKTAFELKGLSRGIYVLKVKALNGKTKTTRFWRRL